MATLPKNTLKESKLPSAKPFTKQTPKLANDRPDGDRESRSDEGAKEGKDQATLPSSSTSSVRGAPPYSKPKENAPKDFTKEVIAQQCAVFPDFLKRKDNEGPVHDNEQWKHKASGAKGK